MTVIEIISAFLLIIACVFVIAVVLMQESKQGMSNVITGGSSDNYYQKNSGRTREAKLSRATKIAAVAIFVIALAVNVISVYFGGSDEAEIQFDTNAAVTTTAAAEEPEAEVEDAAAEDAETTEAAE
ncbi:MAG: preprotein translocase subunit SecG [Ruminiclostridium sp.]|nr:preprotein translocase subunit SecG [Ruminiclostridium sp.]MBQ8825886.1 preprotein translocase subunit SecG [Oscillospiraceae bacterium]